MTRQSLSLMASLCICIQHANALIDPCQVTIGGLAGVKLGMKLSEIVKVLGPGRLEYKYDGDHMDTRSSYSWRKGGFHIDVNFGEDSRALGIIVGSKAKLSLLGRVRLNVDTYAQIVREFGVPSIEEEPNYGEADFVYYSYGYTCHAQGGSKVLFMIGMQCKNPNMGQCLDTRLLRNVPIFQVEVGLQK